MAQTIRDVMTAHPFTVQTDSPLTEVARAMRDQDIGDVLVCESDRLHGIVTDRDIAVRAVAEGRDPATTTAGDVCTSSVTTVAPDDAVDHAVQLMREHAVRRLPVVEGERPVGIVSLGDLAIEHDGETALADISAAPPDN